MSFPDGGSTSHVDNQVIPLFTLYRHLFSAAQPKGSVHFFVPLGNKKWFASAIGTSENDVTEFDWWDHASFSTTSQTGSKLRITCTPCQHFANRSIWDRNHTLWASWAVEQIPSSIAAGQAVSEKPICKIWFGGDTAYKGVRKDMTPEEEAKLPHCPAFEEIGDKFKSFDFAVSQNLISFQNYRSSKSKSMANERKSSILTDDTYWSLFTTMVYVTNTCTGASISLQTTPGPLELNVSPFPSPKMQYAYTMIYALARVLGW